MPFYEHFIYGPTEAAVTAVVDELTPAGYLVPDPIRLAVSCDPESGYGSDCGGCAHHWIVILHGDLDKAFADGGRDDIDAACARHGATYDGGGFSVGEPDVAELVEGIDGTNP